MNKAKRTALYCRVSTEEQALHGYSLDAQRDALREYADKHNLVVVGTYVDEGISGKLPAQKRPAMMQMLSELDTLGIEQILFIKLDRWFRSVKEYYKVQEILDRHDVTWRAVLEDYNTETSDGILKVNIMLSVAQNEAERTGERIKFVLDNKAQKKQVVGRQPYGYRIAVIDGEKRSVIDENAAPVVRSIFDTFERTSSAYSTAQYVNQKFGTGFSRIFIRRMLRRSAYAGEYMGIKDYRAPYITRERYETNIRILDNNHVKKTPTGRVYIFTGLLFCSSCGHRMKGKCTKTKYYCCTRAVDDGVCDNHKHISELKIENYLKDNVVRLMRDYVISVESQASRSRAESCDTKIASLTGKLDRLNEIYIDGNMDRETYLRRTAQIKTEIDELKKRSAMIRPKDISHIKPYLGGDFLENYDILSDENKRALWRKIISRIEMDNDQNLAVFFL